MLRRVLVIPFFLYTLPAIAQLTPAQKSANLASFEIVWQTVRDQHPDPKLNGLNWQAIHEKTKPLIANASNMNEMRSILREMLAKLDSSHYAIIPGDAYSPADQPDSPRDASPGFQTAVIDGRAVVRSVDTGSPADRAGIRPGMVIADINGSEIGPMVQALDQTKSSEAGMIAERTIEKRLRGPADSPVTLDVVKTDGQRERLAVPRSDPPGDLVTFANLPPMRVIFDAKRLDSGAGYIRLNVFLDPEKVMPELENALRRFDSVPGVILDLRGNPGGIGLMAMGVAGFFVDKGGLKLGEMKTRDLTLKFAVFPRPHTYKGRLAILVDSGSASTSEILAQGMRDLGRARIFGTRTAGAALPSDIIRLPNGDGFQYARASYVSTNGRVLEANGVVPDVEIHETAADLESGRDPVLDAADHWITAPK